MKEELTMSLVAAKCTQCGANLNVDNSLEAAVCPSCKTPFITGQAINNYNTYNQNTYQIQHANLQINDEKSIENRLKNAEVFLTNHKDYHKAMELFKEIAEDAPDDYRTWWGALRALTREFTDISSSYHDSYYYFRATQVAPEDIKGSLVKTWDEFQVKKEKQQKLEKELSELKQELESLKKRNGESERYIEDLRSCPVSSVIFELVFFGIIALFGPTMIILGIKPIGGLFTLFLTLPISISIIRRVFGLISIYELSLTESLFPMFKNLRIYFNRNEHIVNSIHRIQKDNERIAEIDEQITGIEREINQLK